MTSTHPTPDRPVNDNWLQAESDSFSRQMWDIADSIRESRGDTSLKLLARLVEKIGFYLRAPHPDNTLAGEWLLYAAGILQIVERNSEYDYDSQLQDVRQQILSLVAQRAGK